MKGFFFGKEKGERRKEKGERRKVRECREIRANRNNRSNRNVAIKRGQRLLADYAEHEQRKDCEAGLIIGLIGN